MRKETKKHVKRFRGFTLVELILMVGTIALVAGALVGLISNSYKDWELGSNRSTLLQDGRAAMEQMVRILRQAKAFSAVSQSTDYAGYITFTSVDDITEQFKLNALTSELEYGQIGSLSALTGSVSSLVLTCYDINGNVLTGSVSAGNIQSVGIETTLTDGTNSFTLSGRVFCPKDFQSVVINELMYNPSGGGNDAPKEWVELYNLSGSSIDLTGWTIWTGSQTTEDILVSHPQFGNGSMIIPANGYAVITADTTDVYTELVTNGDFESQLKKEWQLNNWSRTKLNAHNGSYKLESDVSGASWVYQNITIPSGLNSYLFLFWERTTSAVGQTQITVTIRNLSGQVLAAGYSGQMHSDWTCHTMNLAAFAGQTIRIYFSATNNGSGVLLLDDVSVASSYVNLDAIRLSCGDNQIGNGLSDTGDTVTVTDGSATVDSVTYDNNWGGDGDGTSLARISPQGPSNDQSNWTSGPQHGTPGSAN